MNYYSYKIEHDFGLAPNPFGGYCTLAVCKPQIRNNRKLNIGDWIFGTGSKKLNRLHQLIYAMQVEEKLSFNQYWKDERFQYKKPVVNGSISQMYGDNFYHQNTKTGKWIQEDSAHSLKDGSPNPKHIERDIGGKYVLTSQIFYYFGVDSIPIPMEYITICSNGRGLKSTSIPTEVANNFISWLQKNYEKGIHADPINWEGHK